MLTLTATDAKTRFGQVLQAALVEPVAIEKNGRELAFVISAQQYHSMQESIRLTRGEFDAFLAAMDAPAKPNAALRRARARHAAMVKVAAT
jgi:prevent-host-death family protein